jgi:glycosyltransferase involved in cell wall biosynthesis
MPPVADLPRVAYTLLQCWHEVPGGTAVSALRVADALVATGEVDLVGVGPWGRGLPEAPWTPSVPLRRLRLPYQLVYDGWHRFGRPTVQSATGRVDVIHATATTVPPAGQARLVVTVHDLFPLTDPERFTPRGVRLLTAGIERARRADLVLCPSQSIAGDCVANGFSPDRLRVVPWGVDPTPADPAAREAVRRRFGLERPFVLWAGTVEPRKNLPLLLDAFERLDHVDLDLVLVGPDGWNEELDHRLRALGDRVRRTGFVSTVELTALYAEAAAFAFPSLREGFGLPALEAMAQGTPVVVSDDPALVEVVDGAGLVAPTGDADAWAEALAVLVDDAAAAERLGHAARERAEQFTWDRSARLTLDAYQEVMG